MRFAARLWRSLTTTAAGLPHSFAKRSIPTAEPKASKSDARWPMISTLSLCAIRSLMAEAMMRLFTLLRFSTLRDTPP